MQGEVSFNIHNPFKKHQYGERREHKTVLKAKGTRTAATQYRHPNRSRKRRGILTIITLFGMRGL